MCSSDIFLGLVAIVFPPLPVWIKTGICSADSLINILLCVLGFVPGLLHSWYIISKFPETEYERIPQDAESGRITYVYVQGSNGQLERQQQPKPQRSQGYGTTAPLNPPALQSQNGTWSGAAAPEGSSAGGAAHPPSYAQAVKGDHKVQTRD